MAESKIHTFFSFGSLQRKIFQIAWRNEALRQSLYNNTEYHHQCDIAHPRNDIIAQQISTCHQQCRNRNQKHADVHGSNGCTLCHPFSNETYTTNHNKRIHIGYPARFSRFACHTDDILRHCGIQLLLHHPESGYDKDKDQQTPVSDDMQKTLSYFAHAFTFACRMCRFVQEDNREQRQYSHRSRKEIDINICLLTDSVTQRINNGLSGESAEIHHHIKDRITACTGSFGSFFGNGCRYNGLDERTAKHNDKQDRNNHPTLTAINQP